MKVQGFGTKTITIPLSKGQQQYRLSEQQRLGLPMGSMILGFMVRYNLFGNVVNYSINGRELAPIEVIQGSYLNLKWIGTRTFQADSNLFNYSSLPNFNDIGTWQNFATYQNFIQPTLVDEISWNKSNIFISLDRATGYVTDIMDIELVVLYTYDSVSNPPPPTQEYIGNSLLAYKTTTIQIDVPIQSEAPVFYNVPLSIDGKSGLDNSDIVLGFRALQYDYRTPDNKPLVNIAVQGSMFFNFKVGREVILDTLPLVSLASPVQLNLPYLPIVPTLAGLIDWQSSNIRCVNNTNGSEEPQALLLQIFHYSPDEM